MPATVVLYIEDNASNLDLVAAILRHRPSVKLHGIANGEAGLATARSLLPDLILLDLHLPGINGMEVLRALREDPTTSAFPWWWSRPMPPSTTASACSVPAPWPI